MQKKERQTKPGKRAHRPGNLPCQDQENCGGCFTANDSTKQFMEEVADMRCAYCGKNLDIYF